MAEKTFQDATSKENKVGVDTANFFEALKAKEEDGYEPKNWDLELGYNRFVGLNHSEMIKEYENSGHSTRFSLNLLLERVNDSYPDKDNRSDFVKLIAKELKNKTTLDN